MAFALELAVASTVFRITGSPSCPIATCDGYPGWTAQLGGLANVFCLQTGPEPVWVVAAVKAVSGLPDNVARMQLEIDGRVEVDEAFEAAYLCELPLATKGPPSFVQYLDRSGERVVPPIDLGPDLSDWLGSHDDTPDGSGWTSYG